MSKPEPGQKVILTSLPHGLIEGLPRSDQKAIKSVVGQAVTLAGYSHGKAELEFVDTNGDRHSIWVDPGYIGPVPV